MTLLVDLTEDGRRIMAKSDLEMRDADRLKQVPGASFTRKVGWTLPLSWATCNTLRGVFDQELAIGPRLEEWSWRVWREQIEPALIARQEVTLPEGASDAAAIAAWRGEEHRLYPFQEAGVQFLVTAKRAWLTDEMGTGKTIQTARALRLLAEAGRDPFPAVVVAPASMLLTWQKELAIWLPDATTAVIRGTIAQRRKALEAGADVTIINFEGVRSHSRLSGYGSVRLKRCVVCNPYLEDVPANAQSRCEHCPKEMNAVAWHTVVVDEAHRLKSPKAKQTRAVWALRTDATEHVWLLTGTPIARDPQDLWSGLHLLDPAAFPNRNKYIERYCMTTFGAFGGLEIHGLSPYTSKEFYRIVDPVMRRMSKEAVLPHLPKKTYETRLVEMTPKQRRAYAEMEKGMLAALDDGTLVAGDALSRATRLTQLASSYVELDESGRARLCAPSSKVDGLLELLEDMGDEPLVVFAQSAQLIALADAALRDGGIETRLIVGGQSDDLRERAKSDFQAGKARVILCTLGAGGVGLTLTRAGTVCFLQRSWSMVENKQAEDRVHRIGSEAHDKIIVVDLVSEGTIEDKQRDVLDVKSGNLEEVVRDRALMRYLLTGKKEER